MAFRGHYLQATRSKILQIESCKKRESTWSRSARNIFHQKVRLRNWVPETVIQNTNSQLPDLQCQESVRERAFGSWHDWVS